MNSLTRKTMKLTSRLFLQGLVVLLPITVTVAVLYWLAVTAEAFLGGLVKFLFPEWDYWAGLGVALGIGLVFAAGLLMHMWFTRMLLARAEELMERIPIVKSIYGSLRDILRFVSGSDADKRFSQVVAVYVTDKIRLIGFVTGQNFSGLPGGKKDTEELVAVYLPLSYQIGGYTAYLPRACVEPVDMSVEDAMRFTLTAGMSASGKPGDTTPNS